MNLLCIICSDNIIPNSEVWTTQCGHLFHYVCLFQWIERSKTCPQCRQSCTEKRMHRVYLNLKEYEGGEDAASLQCQLDSIQFQLKLKEKDVKNYDEKYAKLKQQNILMRQEICDLENQGRAHNSVVLALKDQISFFKSKSKERDKLVDEIAKLKMKQKQLESIEVVINGTRDAVTELLKNENDVDSLVMLVATLKRALLDAEKKKINMEHKFKQLQSDLTKQRRELTVLELSNKELKREVEVTRLNPQKEVRHLIKHVKSSTSSPNTSKNGSLSPNLGCNVSEKTASPSVEDKISDILQSDSPYLRLKKGNSIPKNPPLLLNSAQMSIFKKPKLKIDNIESSKPVNMMYNGLGGQSKEDLFPIAKSPTAALKRHRSDSGILARKFRKMDSFVTKK